MSCIEILVALYFKIMKAEDKFLLSKGWAAAALYAVLARKGIIDWDDLYKNYYETDSKYWGLVHHAVPGVEFSLGSAGHGLPVGIGMALADKKRRVFVLMSDGEMDCGTTWEAALFASHHNLGNLFAIVDYNKFQAFGKTNKVLNLEPLFKKWHAFNWDTHEVEGHNFVELLKVFRMALKKKNKPHVIICHTIKGKGISFAENKLQWHYFNLNEELHERAKRDIC
jgi:transketolase